MDFRHHIASAGALSALATDALLHHIAAMQRKEVDWPNYGPVRPPLEDGGFSHTAMGIRALNLGEIKIMTVDDVFGPAPTLK